MPHIFDIQEFGATPDGTTLNTAAIQRAIDACHLAGGGQVYCGPGTFATGALVLKSRVDLHLASGCRLLASSCLDDYQELVADGFRGENAPEGSSKSLIRAVDAEDVAITGPGEINGSGPAFYDTCEAKLWGRFYNKPTTARPRLVTFFRCRRVRFEDTAFIDSPCWTFWLMKCERVHIQRVTVAGDQRMINNDGIDLDACRDVTVSDSFLRTADDCLILRSINQVYDVPGVCENVTVSNCVLDSWCQGIRVGCPGDGVIRNCAFSNLVITSSGNGILFEFPRHYLPADGQATADVSSVRFANVVINCDGAPIKVAVGAGIALPRVEGLSFSDFRIRSGGPCVVQGSPETTIRNVTFANIDIATTGDDAILCRHCEGVNLTNVRLTNRPGAAAAG